MNAFMKVSCESIYHKLNIHLTAYSKSPNNYQIGILIFRCPKHNLSHKDGALILGDWYLYKKRYR